MRKSFSIVVATICIAVILGLNSCYTASLIETDVLNPAKKSFHHDIYRVGVVSRMDLDVKRSTGRIDKRVKLAFERDSAMLKNAVLGLLDGLAESPRFEAYTIKYPRVLSGGESTLNRAFSWDLANKLASKDTLDMIISLTAANFKDSVLNHTYYLFPHLYWRTYDIRKREVSSFVQIDTLVYPTSSLSGYPARATTIEYLYEALGNGGYEYSHVLAPYWTTIDRVWYPAGDYLFSKAGMLANEGKWKEASEIWKKLAYSDNKRKAAKASLNMAVASEMLDKIDIAIVWAERSKELGPDYYPDLYIKSLKSRKEDRRLLDNQMK